MQPPVPPGYRSPRSASQTQTPTTADQSRRSAAVRAVIDPSGRRQFRIWRRAPLQESGRLHGYSWLSRQDNVRFWRLSVARVVITVNASPASWPTGSAKAPVTTWKLPQQLNALPTGPPIVTQSDEAARRPVPAPIAESGLNQRRRPWARPYPDQVVLRCCACDRIGVRRQAHERPSAVVEQLQCRVRTPPTVARRGPASRDILNGSSMWPELVG